MSDNFNEWWARISPLLLRSATSRLHRQGEAEDLVQEVVLVAWRRRETFATEEDLLRWSFTVLHARIVDFFRAEKRNSTKRTLLGRFLPGAYRPDYERAIDQARVHDLVAQLPPRQRDVLSRWLVGDSTSEIARTLGIAETTVRSVRRFAQLNLTKLMSAQATNTTNARCESLTSTSTEREKEYKK